jgi:hypothetical protein
MGRLSGKDLEERLKTKLEAWCMVHHTERFDHEFKLDFIVTGFKSIPRLTDQIGLQVTTRDDDVKKQTGFLAIHQHTTVTPRTVYLEVDSEADVDGVAVVVYAALVSLVFNRASREKKILGLRIERDFSFEFFALDENIRRLQQSERQRLVQGSESLDDLPVGLPDSIPGEELRGTITTYMARGAYGHIQAAERSIDFFFHISDVDAPLAERLRWEARRLSPHAEPRIELHIPVVFTDGGYTREGARNPQARHIQHDPDSHSWAQAYDDVELVNVDA